MGATSLTLREGLDPYPAFLFPTESIRLISVVTAYPMKSRGLMVTAEISRLVADAVVLAQNPTGPKFFSHLTFARTFR
jgi:hypothetical protein